MIKRYVVANDWCFFFFYRIPTSQSENATLPLTTRTSSSIQRTSIQLSAGSAISSSRRSFQRNEWNTTHPRRSTSCRWDWAHRTQIWTTKRNIRMHPHRIFRIYTKTFRPPLIPSPTNMVTHRTVQMSWRASTRNSVYCCPIQLRTLHLQTNRPHRQLAIMLLLVLRSMLMVSIFFGYPNINMYKLHISFIEMHDDQYGDNLDEPRKKKYAKEAWPGRKPLLSTFWKHIFRNTFYLLMIISIFKSNKYCQIHLIETYRLI